MQALTDSPTRRLSACCVALAIALIAAVGGSTGVAKAEGGECETSLPGRLVVHEVLCLKGQRVISRYAAKAQHGGPRIRVLGFHCAAFRGSSPIRCHRGRQNIFYSGGF